MLNYLKIHILFFLLLLVVPLACTAKNPDIVEELAFSGSRALFPGLSLSSDYLPRKQPIQVKLTLGSAGKVTVTARGRATSSTLAGTVGSGELAASGSFTAAVALRLNLSGAKYDGAVGSSDTFKLAFSARAPFDPFLLSGTTTLTVPIAETPIGTVSLATALGLPGVSGELKLLASGSLTVQFAGVCAASSGGVAQATGRLTVGGKLTVKPVVKVDAPGGVSRTMGPFEIPLSLPGQTVLIDLGARYLAGGDATPASGPCSGALPDGGPADGPLLEGGAVEAGFFTEAGLPKTDGPLGKCNPAAGQPQGGMCKLASDCACPNTCVLLFNKAMGSCWTQCDPAKTEKTTGQNPACSSSSSAPEACVGYGCLGLGTVSGHFYVPVFTYPDAPKTTAELGATTLKTTVPGVGTTTFAYGYGSTLVGSEAYSHIFVFWPLDSSGTKLDQNSELRLIFRKGSNYKAGQSFDLSSTKEIELRYKEYTVDSTTQKITRELVRAISWDGTLVLEQAASGGKLPAKATVSGRMVRYDATICGPGAGACP